MKENLILEKKLFFTESIDKKIEKYKLKQKLRSSMDNLSQIIQRGKSKSLDLLKKTTKKKDNIMRTTSAEKKIKKE